MEKLTDDFEIEDFENCAVCGYCCGEVREFLVNEAGESDPLCDEHYIEVLEMLLDELHGRTDSKRGGGMLSQYSYNPKRLEIIIKDKQTVKKIRKNR